MNAKHRITLAWTERNYHPGSCQPKGYDWAEAIVYETGADIVDDDVVVIDSSIVVVRELFELARESDLLVIAAAVRGFTVAPPEAPCEMWVASHSNGDGMLAFYDQEVELTPDGVVAKDQFGNAYLLQFYNRKGI